MTDKTNIAQNRNTVSNSISATLKKASIPGTLLGLKSGEILTVIGGMKTQISQALPKHLTAERIIQVATTYLHGNSKILECSPESIVGAIVQSSIYGLELSPAFGHAYLVPYNIKGRKEAQFQIGYRGLIKLAHQSNEIEKISAQVVREGDVFECELGLNERLVHIPNLNGTGDERITYSYAVVHYKNGGYNFIILSRHKIESLRKRSPGQKNGLAEAWLTDYDSMAKAKAIKQLSKYMPLSIELQKIIASDQSVITNLSNNGTGIDIDSIIYPEEEVPTKKISNSENEKKDGELTDEEWDEIIAEEAADQVFN